MASVLDQTYHNTEIIVVDDNGIDSDNQRETQKILQQLIDKKNITYIAHEKNKNGSAARNTGLKNAKGEYICFLDDDDILLPRKIELQVKQLQMNEFEFDAAYCNTKVIGKKRTFTTKNKKEGNLGFDLLSGKAIFNTSTLLFRKQVLQELGGFDERFKRHQDLELMLRFFRKNRICLTTKETFLVEKYSTKNVVSKDPLKSIEYRRFFLHEFEKDIKGMKKSRLVYRRQYEELSSGLLANGQKREGFKYFLKSARFGFPTLNFIVKVIYYILK